MTHLGWLLKGLVNNSGIGGGGEDPQKKNVYSSRKDIDKDNEFAKNFLARHGAPSYFVNNAVVARNLGDPKVQFEYQNGRPPIVDTPALQTVLPMGVSINDVFQTNQGTYGFMHPQNGTFVQVDPQSIYSKYGAKK